MNRFTRRNILGAAGAFAGGSVLAVAAGAAIGATAALPAAAGAAISAADPLPAMVDEYFRLIDVMNSCQSQDVADRAFEEEEAIAERIFAAVAPTTAGILAQLRVLRDLIQGGTDGWIDERDKRLLNSITAGVERLGRGAVA